MLHRMGLGDRAIKVERAVEGDAAQEAIPILPLKSLHRKRHVDLVCLAGNGRPNSLFSAFRQQTVDLHPALQKVMRHIAPGGVTPTFKDGITLSRYLRGTRKTVSF
jgi:hypothetical protein